MEHPIEQHGERERAPKRVFVEIGTHSLAASWMGSDAVRPDDLYIGVDLHRSLLETSRDLTQGHGKMNENRLFVQADAEHMPVRDGVVHEVYLGNVMGDPAISLRAKDRFLAEARRIVADDGRVVIKENNTPAELDDVRRLLRTHGFIVEGFIESRSPGWDDAVRPYHRSAAEEGKMPFAMTGYIVYAVPEPTP